MSKIFKKNNLFDIAKRLKDDLSPQQIHGILIYAYNGTGKTRLSMDYKNIAKKDGKKDTLYFNAYTEDLFTWENDLENDSERYLEINSKSIFFAGIKELALEARIRKYYNRYCEVNFDIDYEKWRIYFSKSNTEGRIRDNSDIILSKPNSMLQEVRKTLPSGQGACYEDNNGNIIIKLGSTNDDFLSQAWSEKSIKISRGEENLFIWCFFLAISELVIDQDNAYRWVKYIYIDDPISSLDENNAIMVAADLANILIKSNQIKYIISSHHTLFFNVLANELKNVKKYFLNYHKKESKYSLRTTKDIPFFHHVAMVAQIQKAIENDELYTYHFNIMRTLLEKSANFHGFSDFSECLKVGQTEEEIALHARYINLLSHGGYSLFDAKEMVSENKEHFRNIFNNFMEKYPFNPEIFAIEEVQ